MPYFNNNGTQLYYEVKGEGEVAILITHGFGDTSLTWKHQIDFLSEKYKVIIWDLRGHGRSDSPSDIEEYSEALTLSDMNKLLDTCDVEKAVISGLSLGGYMSLAFNITNSERVQALMLFDTGPGFRNDKARDDWNQFSISKADRLEGGELKEGSEHFSQQGLANSARGMLTQDDAKVMNSLSTIAVPTLVLVGENDKPFFNACDHMAKKIPMAKKVVLEGAGHSANIDQPKAFNEAVLSFLRESGF
ncbi:MAG: alpha/beta hydrolase [Pseudomonadales bacterium]|nr:alpha/beta hydrolase [Pseudomonadales bacterium]